MSKKSMLGSALAEVAGPLKDLAEKLGGKEGEWWLAALKRFLRKEEPWPELSIWRTIKFGTSPKTADEFLETVKAKGYKVSVWANNLALQPEFSRSLADVDPDQEYNLVRLTTAQIIGKKQVGTTAEVFDGAARLGLKKCSAWMGPKVREIYTNQPNGERIIIGMEPISDSEDCSSVFCVEREDSNLLLGCGCAASEPVWLPNSLWVFVVPASNLHNS